MGLRGPLPRRLTKPAASTAEPLPPPPWLPVAAVEVWREYEPRLRAAGRLRPEFGDTFGQWCTSAAELRELAAVIARDGSTATGPHGTHPSAAHSAAVRLRTAFLALGKALGLDPASSARLEAMGGPADDGHDAVRDFAAARDRRGLHDEAASGEGGGLTVLDVVKRHRGTA